MSENLKYFSLVRLSDGKEVYTNPAYTRDGTEVIDYDWVEKTLKFYFVRVNGGIEQQLQSPKLTDEQKSSLKKLELKDYEIHFNELQPLGLAPKCFWKKSALEMLKSL